MVKNGQAYFSDELMKYFIELVLSLEKECGVPEEPMTFEANSGKLMLGIQFNLKMEHGAPRNECNESREIERNCNRIEEEE